MQRACCVFSFVSVLLQAVTAADEPLRVMSNAQHPYFDEVYYNQLVTWANQFSVDDRFQAVLSDEIDSSRTNVKTRWEENLSASAMVDIQHLTESGSIVRIVCWKVSGPEALAANRDEYLGWMDGKGTSTVQGDFVVVRGPTTVTEKDGRRETRGWLPLILRYEDGWLFQSVDEEFVNWSPGSDLVSRLDRFADKPWFREARPTKVSKSKRAALLGQTFAVLGTVQQRLDGESDTKFAERAAPSALWEQLLRTQFFQTDSISGWRSRFTAGQSVRYVVEVTARQGSEFAEVLKHLRNRALQSSPKSSWCSLAASCNIPVAIGSQLASLIPVDYPNPMAQRLALETVRSLQSGTLHVGSWLKKGDDEKLLNGMIELVPVGGLNNPLEASSSVDESSVGSVFARQEIKPDGSLETQLGEIDPAISTIDSQPVGTGALPVLFKAKLNVLEFARIGKGTDEFDLYEFCQDKYVRYRCPRLRDGSLPAPFKLRPEDRKALDALREKIVGEDADRWTVSVAMSVHSRKRQLAIRVSVGDELYGFLTVAEKYWVMSANNAVFRNAKR